MRIIGTLLVFVLTFSLCKAQTESKEALYDPDANAMGHIRHAVEKAHQENKHVLIQVGGNWCPWCIRLNHFIEENTSLDSLVTADYVLVHVNYSKDNKNPDVMTMLDFPQRFGFPVLVILDGSGKRLHTQNTAYLEEGESYNEKKIREFLLDWNPAAVNLESYLNK